MVVAMTTGTSANGIILDKGSATAGTKGNTIIMRNKLHHAVSMATVTTRSGQGPVLGGSRYNKSRARVPAGTDPTVVRD